MAFQDIQEKAFTRWVNNYLKKRGLKVDNLFKDLQDGIVLINLLEVLTEGMQPRPTMPRYNKKARIAVMKIENLGIALRFIQEQGVKLVNISGEDIHDGNQRIILGLIWSLILRYQINLGMEDRDGNPNTSAKDELLEWVRSKIPEYDIKNFKADWKDGRALNALQDALLPGMCPAHRSLDPAKGAENNQAAIDRGHDEWGVPKLLEGGDLSSRRPDEHSNMCYIAFYRDLDPSKFTPIKAPKRPEEDAEKSQAYGPGLVEGIQEQEAPFTVETPPDCEQPMDVKVFGPDGAPLPAKDVIVTKADGGKYGVVYTPHEPGEYKVHVTVGGHHVPGSVFTVLVLEDESLGGQGKILVFYNTTSSTNKAKADVVNMQKLLEKKSIHKRPDFEPWIPVDIMTRDDREAVFRKAGTRILPIVFIDDKYVGDYDTVLELEASGKLDKLLRYNPNIEW